MAECVFLPANGRLNCVCFSVAQAEEAARQAEIERLARLKVSVRVALCFRDMRDVLTLLCLPLLPPATSQLTVYYNGRKAVVRSLSVIAWVPS